MNNGYDTDDANSKSGCYFVSCYVERYIVKSNTNHFMTFNFDEDDEEKKAMIVYVLTSAAKKKKKNKNGSVITSAAIL